MTKDIVFLAVLKMREAPSVSMTRRIMENNVYDFMRFYKKGEEAERR
jgi:hypothetical protein